MNSFIMWSNLVYLVFSLYIFYRYAWLTVIASHEAFSIVLRKHKVQEFSNTFFSFNCNDFSRERERVLRIFFKNMYIVLAKQKLCDPVSVSKLALQFCYFLKFDNLFTIPKLCKFVCILQFIQITCFSNCRRSLKNIC